jgi:hypothetical protein
VSLTWDGCSARDRSFTADGASRRSKVPRPAWLEATTCFFRERRGRRRGATFGGDRSGWFDSCRRRACSGEAGDRTNLLSFFFFLARRTGMRRTAKVDFRLPVKTCCQAGQIDKPTDATKMSSRRNMAATSLQSSEWGRPRGGTRSALVAEFPVGQISRRNKISTRCRVPSGADLAAEQDQHDDVIFCSGLGFVADDLAGSDTNVRNLGFAVYSLFLCAYPWCRSQIAYMRLGDRDLLILFFQRVHLLYKYKIPSRTSFRDTVQIKLPTTIQFIY